MHFKTQKRMNKFDRKSIFHSKYRLRFVTFYFPLQLLIDGVYVYEHIVW